MITVNGYLITPTIFPDGTSQVWKLPDEVTKAGFLRVDWRFESEREIYDLLSLRALAPALPLDLYIPYLPFGRQDKQVSNETTFNLAIFLRLIRTLDAHTISTLDAHNPKYPYSVFLGHGFENTRVEHFHRRLCDEVKPDFLVFPDTGAFLRYEHKCRSYLIFEKERDANGNIIRHVLVGEVFPKTNGHRYLILDDICDGGATFISVAKAIRALDAEARIFLFVTHGIFSKGREHLIRNGINAVFTTNSLPRNNNEPGVMKV